MEIGTLLLTAKVKYLAMNIVMGYFIQIFGFQYFTTI